MKSEEKFIFLIYSPCKEIHLQNLGCMTFDPCLYLSGQVMCMFTLVYDVFVVYECAMCIAILAFYWLIFAVCYRYLWINKKINLSTSSSFKMCIIDLNNIKFCSWNVITFVHKQYEIWPNHDQWF